MAEGTNLADKMPIRVLIVDDHPTFAQGLSRLLAEQSDLEPIGIAADGEEAVRLAHDLKPDVVVMDVSMPKLNGIEATKKIKKELPNTIVLVLSAYGYHPYVLSALEAGAAGYLLKSVPMRELMNAIRALCVGEAVLDQKVAEKLLRSLAKPLGEAHVSGYMSPIELQVLKLGARGLSNKEIGDELSLSERTIQSHFTSIFQKLSVGSRIEAALKALKEGWLTIDDIP
jgi:NarL family two-component system response regulator LiaR